MKHLVNIVTVSRVFIALLFYVFVVVLQSNIFILLITCFILIECSDLFDGMLARKTNNVSDIGKLLDPVCDVSAHFICIFALEKVGFVPSIVLIIFVLREVWMQLLRSLLVRYNVVMAANWAGKVKTWLFGIAIFMAIFSFPDAPFGAYTLALRPVVWALFYIAAASSVLSGMQYVVIGMNLIKKTKTQ